MDANNHVVSNFIRKLEKFQVDKGCVLITVAGSYLSCGDATISRAMLIYHNYQKSRQQKEFTLLYATASLALSADSYEENLKKEDIIRIFDLLGKISCTESCMELLEQKMVLLQLENNTAPEPCMEMLVDVIMDLQQDMRKLIFGARPEENVLICNTAHKYVYRYLNQHSPVKTLSVKFMNTFYCCQKSTTYTAIEIAWAAMYLAYKVLHVNFNHIKGLKQEQVKAVEEGRFRDVKENIMMMVSTFGFEMFQSSFK